MSILMQRIAALLVFTSLSAGSLAADVVFSAQADQPIATLTRVHGMVRGVVDEPLVTVFGDGLVRVNRAPYMIRPGVSEFRLDAAALNALVGTLSDTFALSNDQLARDIDTAAAARTRSTGEMFVTLDATTTKLDLSLDSFSRDGAKATVVRTSLALNDVQEQAGRYDVASLQALAKAERALLGLMKISAATEGANNER